MKHVLAFGTGGAVTALRYYFSTDHQYACTIISEVPSDEAGRQALINNAQLVISMVDAEQQQWIAQDCIQCGRHLVSPAGINEKIMNLRPQVENSNMLFLYEMGFDPGLDHMSALHCINRLRLQGAHIRSVYSHSGRLVLPEHDNNPWHCKTDNAHQLINTGKAGAVYKERDRVHQLKYEEIFNASRLIEFPATGFLSWYPVADSMGYIPLYGLNDVETFIRTNLQHPDFIYGWKNVIDLKLTSEQSMYETDGMTLADFFRVHFDKHGFSGWLEQKMVERFSQTKQILEKLMQFMEVEQAALEGGHGSPDNILMVDEKGKLENIDLGEVKDKAAAMVAYKMHEANLTLKQLFFLGMDDQQTVINKGKCSAAGVLQFALQQKLSLQPHEHDMALMMHEIEYELQGERSVMQSNLLLRGTDHYLAHEMVTGLTLGIAAKLILEGQLRLKGLHIPVLPEIYEPVLNELRRNGVLFMEEQRRVR
ncbi:MAG TPA: saccharopine dehydrogenase C-terminal domain-containing protein [Chitinophagaceae bacterium]|nr:saccharopine dehydrogenase C-terminal domain-containing protein [Chitinophagaceae bacterium]